MAARSDKPVTVTLGGLTRTAQARVESGRYASLSEVVRAGLRALDREEEQLAAYARARVAQALAEQDEPVSLDRAFASVRERLEARWSADDA